jgi:hypothetical protein
MELPAAGGEGAATAGFLVAAAALRDIFRREFHMACGTERDVLMQHCIAHLVASIAQFMSRVVHTVFQSVHDFMQRVVMVFVVSGFVSSVGHGRKPPGNDTFVVSPPQ